MFETLRYKQRIIRELEEDLILLERGLVESDDLAQSSSAQLESSEVNRQQLQKELDLHNEKVQRVNRQIARLDKEVGIKCGPDSDYMRSDIKLKTLREISRATLRTIGHIKESQPQMSYDIELTIQNVGLRLPTPSPIHSPASSARLSARSSASSRSMLSRRSGSSTQSERLAPNTG